MSLTFPDDPIDIEDIAASLAACAIADIRDGEQRVAQALAWIASHPDEDALEFALMIVGAIFPADADNL